MWVIEFHHDNNDKEQSGGGEWCLVQHGPQPTTITNNNQFCFSGSTTTTTKYDVPSGTYHNPQQQSISVRVVGPNHSSSSSFTTLPPPLETSKVTTTTATTTVSWFPSFLSNLWPFASNSSQLFRRNPHKQKRSTIYHNNNHKNHNHSLLSFIRYKPTTTILLLLQVGLFGVYWNNRVAPSAVAKHYSHIVHGGELWRTLSGATAHFETLHLGFNMMALYALGHQLEQNNSVVFFQQNLSLIVLTSLLMLAMIHVQLRHYQQQRQHHQQQQRAQALRETSSVGYSGVLFAWMVVASLQQESTCPLPVLTQLCFPTHSLGSLRFSWGPLVQLVAAQVLLPRVSFVGHLAGIVAGYLLCWKLVPPPSLLQPSVLIPTVLLAYYYWGPKKLLPIPTPILLEEEANDEEEEEDNNRQRRQRIPLLLLRACFYGLVVNILVGVGAILVFGLEWASVLQLSLVVALYRFGLQAESAILQSGSGGGRLTTTTTTTTALFQQHSRQLSCTLWRAFVVCGVVAIVTDSMTLGAWWIVPMTATTTTPSMVALWMVRILAQTLAVIVVSHRVEGTTTTSPSSSSGIFRQALGLTVLDPSHAIVTQWLLPFLQVTKKKKKKKSSAFQGRGFVLGRNSNSASPRNNKSPGDDEEEQQPGTAGTTAATTTISSII